MTRTPNYIRPARRPGRQTLWQQPINAREYGEARGLRQMSLKWCFGRGISVDIPAEGIFPHSRTTVIALATLDFIHCPAGHRCHRALGNHELGRSPAPPPAVRHGPAVPHGAHGARKSSWAAVHAGHVAAPRVPPTCQAASRLGRCPASHATQRRVRRARQLATLSASRRAPRGSRPACGRVGPRAGALGCYVIAGSAHGVTDGWQAGQWMRFAHGPRLCHRSPTRRAPAPALAPRPRSLRRISCGTPTGAW